VFYEVQDDERIEVAYSEEILEEMNNDNPQPDDRSENN
jgi:hypothetical protein